MKNILLLLALCPLLAFGGSWSVSIGANTGCGYGYTQYYAQPCYPVYRPPAVVVYQQPYYTPYYPTPVYTETYYPAYTPYVPYYGGLSLNYFSGGHSNHHDSDNHHSNYRPIQPSYRPPQNNHNNQPRPQPNVRPPQNNQLRQQPTQSFNRDPRPRK